MALRADRLADADLARALGDRHQHDVHDADAANHQANSANAAQQECQRAGYGGCCTQEVLLGEDVEII